MPVYFVLRTSHLPNKKYDAIFSLTLDKQKTEGQALHKCIIIPFGAKNYSDYTLHKDKARRERYLKRHKKEDWSKINAGSLSRYILWGDSTDLSTNIKEFKKMFHLQ